MTVIGKDKEGYDIVQCDACGKTHRTGSGYIGCFRPWNGVKHYCCTKECAGPHAIPIRHDGKVESECE